MTHPEDRMAAYVDGLLTAEDRRSIEQHLASCAQCRAEVEHARAAAAALRGLEDVPAPDGVASRSLREAATGRRPHRWFRFVPAAAAAAAILAIFTLALPRLANRVSTAPGLAQGGPGGTSGAAVGGGAQLRTAAQKIPVQIDPTDYDAEKLTALVRAAAATYRQGAAGPSFGAIQTSPQYEAADQARNARGCLLKTLPIQGGAQPLRLIETTFEGQPVYIGVFAEGSAAGQPPDEVVAFVVRRSDCVIVSFAQQRLDVP